MNNCNCQSKGANLIMFEMRALQLELSSSMWKLNSNINLQALRLGIINKEEFLEREKKNLNKFLNIK